MRDTNLLILGTSIMWGQGLEETDKMHHVLKELLQGKASDHRVKVFFWRTPDQA